jgi:hypothetical protein
MKEKTNKSVRLYFGIALSVMTVIVGALFIWQVLDIYFTGISSDFEGAHIFTREDVIARLARISPAFWIWVVMIVAGYILSEVFPVQVKRTPYKDNCYTLKKLKKRMPANVGSSLQSSYDEIKKQEKIILIIKAVVACLMLCGVIYAIVYLATPAHFPKKNITGEMVNMVKHIFPCVIVAFALACGVVAYENYSAKKQLAEVKKIIAQSKNAESDVEAQNVKACPLNKLKAKWKEITGKKYFKLVVRIIIACLAVAFIIAGIFNDGMHGILIKAINICTECIGLG